MVTITIMISLSHDRLKHVWARTFNSLDDTNMPKESFWASLHRSMTLFDCMLTEELQLQSFIFLFLCPGCNVHYSSNATGTGMGKSLILFFWLQLMGMGLP